MSKHKKKPSLTDDNPRGGHIEFSVEELTRALALLKGVMLRRAIRKDLASYHFSAAPGGVVTISASDEKTGLQLRVPAMSVTGTGTVMIDAQALNALLGSYREPRVRIHLDEAQTEVRVEGLQAKLKLPAYDPAKEMRSVVPSCIVRSGWFFDADALDQAIALTKGFADEDATRYALGGLLFGFPEDPADPTEIVSCDGRRLSRVRLRAEAANNPARLTRPGHEERWTLGMPVVPLKAIQLTWKLCKLAHGQRVGIAIIPGEPKDLERDKYHPGKIQIVTRDAVLTTEPEPGRFPHYRDVYPTDEVRCEVRLDRASRLADLVGLATATTNSESKGVEVTMAGGCIMMEAESNTRGKSRLSLTELDMTGQGAFAVDALFFRQFLDALGHRPVVIEYRGGDKPLCFSSGVDWDGVLMPLTKDRGYQPPAPASEPVELDNANPDDLDPYGPQDEEDGGEPEGDSMPTRDPDRDGVSATVAAEPEPVVPEAIEPATVKANGHAKPSRNGRHKKN